MIAKIVKLPDNLEYYVLDEVVYNRKIYFFLIQVSNLDDIVSNNNTTENVISTVLSKLGDSVDGFIDVLSDKVESMNLDFNQIDIEKYKGLIERFTQK